jgi:hypothetical protein
MVWWILLILDFPSAALPVVCTVGGDIFDIACYKQSLVRSVKMLVYWRQIQDHSLKNFGRKRNRRPLLTRERNAGTYRWSIRPRQIYEISIAIVGIYNLQERLTVS